MDVLANSSWPSCISFSSIESQKGWSIVLGGPEKEMGMIQVDFYCILFICLEPSVRAALYKTKPMTGPDSKELTV